jgi:hypothetical protein
LLRTRLKPNAIGVQRQPAHVRKYAAELGQFMREGLAKNHQFRRDLEAANREGMPKQISLASRMHGFALRESAWKALPQATIEELVHLTMLALLPDDAKSFCETRIYLLETPTLWPVLAGKEAEDCPGIDE